MASSCCGAAKAKCRLSGKRRQHHDEGHGGRARRERPCAVRTRWVRSAACSFGHGTVGWGADRRRTVPTTSDAARRSFRNGPCLGKLEMQPTSQDMIEKYYIIVSPDLAYDNNSHCLHPQGRTLSPSTRIRLTPLPAFSSRTHAQRRSRRSGSPSCGQHPRFKFQEAQTLRWAAPMRPSSATSALAVESSASLQAHIYLRSRGKRCARPCATRGDGAT